MANVTTIDSAPADLQIQGGEAIPISDGGVPKKTTTGDLRDFIVASMLAADGQAGVENVAVLVRTQGNALRLVNASDFAAAAEAALLSELGADSLPDGAVFPVGVSGTPKTVTFAKLGQLLQAHLSASASSVNIAGMTDADPLADANLVLLDQSGNVKSTLGAVKSHVLAGLAAYVGNLSESQGAASSKLLLLATTPPATEGGSPSYTLYTATLSGLASLFGNVRGPETRTSGNIPAWGNAGNLTDGRSVNSGELVADGTDIPTDGAVYAAIAAAVNGLPTSTQVSAAISAAISNARLVSRPQSVANGYVPTYDDEGNLGAGFPVRSDIRDEEFASDSQLPTEKAVRDAIQAILESISSSDGVPATVDTVCIPGAAFAPSSATSAVAPAEASGFADVNGCWFDAIMFAGDAATAADAEFALPSDWDGGDLRVKIAWSPVEAGTAGDLVRFLVATAFLSEGSAVANPSALAPTPVTDALLSDDVDTTHITDAFTVTPPTGATGGVPVHLHLARDVSFVLPSGTMSDVPVGVLSVLVQYKRTNDRGMW